MLVFSTTDRASFEAVPAWKQKVSHVRQQPASSTHHAATQMYRCKGFIIMLDSEAKPAKVLRPAWGCNPCSAPAPAVRWRHVAGATPSLS